MNRRTIASVAAGTTAILARYDRAMQSTAPVATARPLAGERPRPPDPRRPAGAGPRRRRAGEARGHHRRGRRSSTFRSATTTSASCVPLRRAGAGREAVGPGPRHRREGRAGIRPPAAAGDRAARRRDRDGRGDLVRAPLRGAPPAGGRRGRDQRQGGDARLAAAVHLARSSRRPAASRSTPRGSCRSIGWWAA